MVFLHAFGSTDDLPVAVIVYAYGNENGYVLDLAAPAALQVYSVSVNIGVFILKRTCTLGLYVLISFLVQVAYGAGRDLAAPQGFGDVLDPSDGDTGQVHLNEGFLD